MAISLGLKRVNRLLDAIGSPQAQLNAVHVSGTNGKGSVCAYIVSVLINSGVRVGCFNSPHLIDRWDCVTINGQSIDKNEFLDVEKHVSTVDKTRGIGSTEFEIATAVAFELFKRKSTEAAVIEVGMGGRLDATNVFVNPLVTIVTKIGLDHQGFLGNALIDIAREKAGIFKHGAPVVIDGSNEPQIVDVLMQEAKKADSGPISVAEPLSVLSSDMAMQTESFGNVQVKLPLPGKHQYANAACAISALSYIQSKFPGITNQSVCEGIANTKWRGRMDWISLEVLERPVKLLLDGAHNPQAAESLASYVDSLRSNGITWVLAFSEGKEIQSMLKILLRPGDVSVCTTFSKPDGMPWVSPISSDKIAETASSVFGDTIKTYMAKDARTALETAAKLSSDQIVVCGSLYLIGDVYRLARDG